ncbi:MAG: metallophosphoesterase family protein [Deltaproteobacteria bacterium]|nr:metallophosphoesterase family protein [Deltaproteobacteria bacterium]
MRYAILSDIHGNLEALTAVLERLRALAVDRYVSLGDVVGYNTNPNECLALLKALGATSIQGNHDAAGCGLEAPVNFNPAARQAILWTQAHLAEEHARYLQGLAPQADVDGAFLAVHGSIRDRDEYIFTERALADNLALLEAGPGPARVCFFGHTHVQVAYWGQGRERGEAAEDPLVLKADAVWMVNPGSVGQPRDGDPRAAFAVFDSDARTVSFFRVPYDIERCARKILAADLPRQLAERLHHGW